MSLNDILTQLYQSAIFNISFVQKEPISPSLILSILAILVLVALRQKRLAGYLLLFVGIGAIGGSWAQFKLSGFTAWGWWFMSISHLPMLMGGLWLLERNR